MATMQDLENEIQKIKERNKRVEREKAWEVSWTRKLVISIPLVKQWWLKYIHKG